MEELEKIFRETVDENNVLLQDNTELTAKLAELEVTLQATTSVVADSSTDVAAAQRTIEENAALMSEISQLREAVGRQSQTILEMDEKLRQQNSLAVEFETLIKDKRPSVVEEVLPGGAGEVMALTLEAQETVSIWAMIQNCFVFHLTVN